MIILPVEKRLKWSRAPFVLFGIVLINIAIFFFYQMNDTGKLVEAAELYQKDKLHEIEVPVYLDYVRLPENKEQRKALEKLYQQAFENEPSVEQEQLDKLMNDAYDSMGMDYDPDELEQQIREKRYYQIAPALILQDSGFYGYLESKPKLFESTEQYDSWKANRVEINDLINSSSSAKFALTPADKNWFTFISHQFMHGDIMHLAGNMFFLIVCGFAVEAAIGHMRFLLFYLLSGVAGGVGHMVSDPNSIIPLVGASGAISGVMAMYMGIFRFRKIEFFYWFYVLVGYFRAPALLILALYMGKEVYSYFYADDGVAYMAHLGGFIAGFVLIAGVLLFKRDFLDDEYIEEDDSLDPLQAQQAEIMAALEKLHFKKALGLVSQAVEAGSVEDKYYRDNVLLTAKLLFLTDNPKADEFVVNLLANNKPKADKLDDYLALWKRVKNHGETPAEARMQLGLSFSELEDVTVSESIFMSLAKQKFRDARMSVLAGRLAYHYDQKQQPDKADYYLKLSNAFKQA